MDEPQSEISIEVNAPPSIELDAGNIVSNQPVLMTGEPNQSSQNLFNVADPQNVSFVMGPNGQLIAVAKPPFVWKHFWIGGGIPFALYVVPLLLMLIASGFSEGEYIWDDVELVSEENSTAYTGEITLDSDYRLEWCGVYIDYNDMEQSHRYVCEANDDQASILNSHTNEIVGYWNGQNGTIYLDAGIDHGNSSIIIQFEAQVEAGFLMEILYDAEELMIFSCCLGFLLSIVLLIVGFSTGKPGMGWGGVAALVAFPFIGILAAGIA